MIIALDFDGTCVEHAFPHIGKEIGATPVLKELVKEGHQLILWTMRSNVSEPESTDPLIHTESGDFLSQAIEWFKEREIPLYGINQNPDQMTWTASPKAFAHYYIDDKSLGIPLTDQGYVDWKELSNLLKKAGLLKWTKEEKESFYLNKVHLYSQASSIFLSEPIPPQQIGSLSAEKKWVSQYKKYPFEFFSEECIEQQIKEVAHLLMNTLKEYKRI